LQQLLDEPSERFENNQRVKYCDQIADALSFCHSNRVLHLDVKPANILLTDDLLSCKLGDFGCSRIMAARNWETANAIASICLSASTPGTLMYKAPELLRGAVPTPKADVYSFGYVMWQCASRQSPFEGMNMHTIVFCVVAKGLRPVLKPELVEKLTDEEKFLRNLGQECWKATPDERPDLPYLHKVLKEFISLTEA
jgi:proto-oncogene serine/threonine-protein kinase mos